MGTPGKEATHGGCAMLVYKRKEAKLTIREGFTTENME